MAGCKRVQVHTQPAWGRMGQSAGVEAGGRQHKGRDICSCSDDVPTNPDSGNCQGGRSVVCERRVRRRACWWGQDAVGRDRRGRVHSHDLDACLLYTSDAADEEDSVDLGGRRIIKKKKKKKDKKYE
eukprot:TRINITY_DN52205_c0_g1_i1.p2 TRINITY_DN52205_c0_g1~~TRINITY_DN52205_c0_g1_i1.p2  ORF type:complete len:127 (-),score=25.35 TRINITY_DN52205_c0_g1_i1:64-444(-)